VDDTNPNVLRRLETRLLVRDASGFVYGASYKWRADNSDADLVTAGTNENISVKTADSTRIQKWFYPGRQDCITCHTPQSGGVLGVKTRQLNGNFKYPNGVTDNQLRAWNDLGLFDKKINELEIPFFAKLVSVTNTAAPLQLRVRSYLDANCAMCHRPGGAGAFFDARFDTPLKLQNLINGPVQNPLGIIAAKVIVPGDTNKSILFRRITITGQNQMPPLAKNVVDTNAVAAIGKWILSLHIPVASLPKNWRDADIGNVSSAGEASSLNGLFNLIASGDDIWDVADSFHFAARPLTGDGQIVARVTSLQFTDPWAKAGVMFRENFSPGSRHALMVVTAGDGSAFQRRETADKISGNTDGPTVTIPYWVKLVRAGDNFTGYLSADGKDWRRVDGVTIPMGKTIYVGLALTAHNNSALNSSLFDNVTVSP
jgi:mono/diheme cytochrome c family protein